MQITPRVPIEGVTVGKQYRFAPAVEHATNPKVRISGYIKADDGRQMHVYETVHESPQWEFTDNSLQNPPEIVLSWDGKYLDSIVRGRSASIPHTEPLVRLADYQRLKQRHDVRLKELKYLNETLAHKNRVLDALHYVWCSGGCQTGTHRWDDGKLTEELVSQAESQVKRMRIWLESNKFRSLPPDEKKEYFSTVDKLRALSVTNVMLDVVPGEDGIGEAVYATSVEDVQKKLTELSNKVQSYRVELKILKNLLEK